MRISLFVISLITAMVGGSTARAEPFLAGAATSNITPEIGSEIIGGFVPFPAKHVHDELRARCLVLDDGKTKVGAGGL